MASGMTLIDCTHHQDPQGAMARAFALLSAVIGVAVCAANEALADYFAAAQRGDTGEIEFLLDEGDFNIDAQDVDGSTALHYASFGGHASTVDFLLRNKARTDLAASHGGMALHLAASQNQVKVVALLLKGGASIDAATRCESSEACDSGITPLMAAVEQEHAPMVRALLDAGADVLREVPMRGDALDSAEYKGSDKIALLLRRTIKRLGLEKERDARRLKRELQSTKPSDHIKSDPNLRAAREAEEARHKAMYEAENEGAAGGEEAGGGYGAAAPVRKPGQQVWPPVGKRTQRKQRRATARDPYLVPEKDRTHVCMHMHACSAYAARTCTWHVRTGIACACAWSMPGMVPDFDGAHQPWALCDGHAHQPYVSPMCSPALDPA